MRAQAEREEQTVLIGTALAVFAAVLGAEVLGLWLVHSVLGVALGRWTQGCVAVVAGAVAVANLVRSERG
jgi:ABC-type proline/glycine betaine transport system permease subunit